MRSSRGRGGANHDGANNTRRPQSRNKHWVPDEGHASNGSASGHHSDSERWERGGHRGGRGIRGAARGGRTFPNASLRVTHDSQTTQGPSVNTHSDQEGTEHEDETLEEEEREPETQEEREKFYQEVSSH